MREIREKMCETKLKKYGTIGTKNRSKCSWKSGWRIIAGMKFYFRSSWEANYARFLEMEKLKGMILDWEHEPVYFKFEKEKTGSISFLPDFRIITLDGLIEYHEVKGWFDDRSKETLARMAEYYPEVIVIVVCKKLFKEHTKELSKIIEGWER